MAYLIDDVVGAVSKRLYGHAGEEVVIISKDHGDMWIVKGQGESFFTRAENISDIVQEVQERAEKQIEAPRARGQPRRSKKVPPPDKQTSLF